MTFLSGDDLSAAAMEKIANPPRARVLNSVAQSFANNTFVELSCTEQDFVYNITHDAVGNPTRFTITVDGIYLLTGAICFGTNGTGIRAAKWQRNGVDISGGGSNMVAYTPGQPLILARSTMISLQPGDYVSLLGFQNSGGALSTYVGADYIRSEMSIRLVRDNSL